MQRPLVEVPGPDDVNLGFLSAMSKHRFVIGSLEWPSVEHYLLGKKFEGTTLEEEVRRSRSLHAARMLTNPRTIVEWHQGSAIKKVVYGKTKGFHARDDYRRVYRRLMEEATKAKYDQNPAIKRKLIKLANMDIVDEGNALSAEITSKLRDIYVEEAKPVKKIPRFSGEYKDLASADLSEDEDRLIKMLVKIAEWLRNIEGQDQVHPEMFEDAIYNVLHHAGVTEERIFETIELITTWVSEAFCKWTYIVTTMHNFDGVVAKVSSEVVGRAGEVIVFQTSVVLATFIRWIRVECDGKVRGKILKVEVKMSTVVIPPKVRLYRKNMPCRLVVPRKAKVEEVEVIDGDGDVEVIGEVEGDEKEEVPGFEEVEEDLEQVEAVEEAIDEEEEKEVEEEEPLGKIMERGAWYITNFTPLKMEDSVYSVVVSRVEEMDVEDRKKWMGSFEKRSLDGKRLEVGRFSKAR